MEAALQRIRVLAREMLTGRLDPLDGARRIAAEAAGLDDPAELEVFARLAADGDEHAILEEASLLVADTA